MAALTLSCARAGAPPAPPPTPAQPASTSFADDVAFLEKHGKVIVLTSSEGGRIALSPTYQGRVMTSAVGAAAPSLGWIHRKFIDAAKTGTAFDNYGGEDRFWLGPEGGQFGLYFPPGKPFAFASWQTPPALQEGEWKAVDTKADSVTFTRDMAVKNYKGIDFRLSVTRTVRLLTRQAAQARLGVAPTASWVGFEVENRVTNTGDTPWTKETGLPSIWILGMYNPSADTRVVIPFETGDADREIVNDRYFGKVPQERLRVHVREGYMHFVCDGKHRSKIGLGPARAKNVLGSYSEASGLLTLVQYDKPQGATDYVNSMWEVQKEPFAGDVVNSYNDGPTEPGGASLGGFYEIETSSPALALGPGQSAVHVQRTFHLVGGKAELAGVARKVLGAPVE